MNEVGQKKRSEGHHHPVRAAVAVAEAVIALPLRLPDQDPIHHLLDHIPRHPEAPPLPTPVVHLDPLLRAPEAAVDQDMFVVEVAEKDHSVVAVQTQNDHIREVVARTGETGKSDLGDRKVLTLNLDHPNQWT
jgi:hypothetical protein